MDKDIVTRLRCCSPYSEDGTINSNMRLIAEAANEITTLREQLRDREAEILRLRTTETASAHALDTVRQAMGICLDPSETPSTIAARIVARFDEVGNG